MTFNVARCCESSFFTAEKISCKKKFTLRAPLSAAERPLTSRPIAAPPLETFQRACYIVTDSHMLQVSGSVQVDTVDIGKSDHFLVWMELGQTVKTTKQQ